MTTLIEADIASALAVGKGVFTTGNPADRDSSLDITFNCLGYDRIGDPNQGVGFAYASADGGLPFDDVDTTAIAYGSASGSPIWGIAYDGEATAYASADGELLLQGAMGNWAQWSKIGSFDFDKGRDNTAGKIPLDWDGVVHHCRKLGGKVVYYGTNGVSVLSPAGVMFGVSTIHKVGLLGRDAFAGNDNIHYFIDKNGCLHSLSDQLQMLDYREYLASLIDPVLSFDESENLLYICDGTSGFIYSPDSKSMGEGPANITGIGYKNGVQYAVASGAISIPSFEIWTDTYDFGSRNGKNIFSVEFGIDVEGVVEGAIRMRQDKASAWSQTSWQILDPRGTIFIPCYGHEFRFGLKADVYEYFEPDYIRIEGEINAY